MLKHILGDQRLTDQPLDYKIDSDGRTVRARTAVSRVKWDDDAPYVSYNGQAVNIMSAVNDNGNCVSNVFWTNVKDVGSNDSSVVLSQTKRDSP